MSGPQRQPNHTVTLSRIERGWVAPDDYAVVLHPAAPQRPRIYSRGLGVEEAAETLAMAQALGHRAEILPEAVALRRVQP